MSALPSPLKSLTAIALGLPAANGLPASGVNPPAPSPSRTVTLPAAPLLKFAIARSMLPSPLKSPEVIDSGSVPTPNGLPIAGVKPPLPLPSRTVTLFADLSAMAKSGLPSLLKSATAIATGDDPVENGLPAAELSAVEPLALTVKATGVAMLGLYEASPLNDADNDCRPTGNNVVMSTACPLTTGSTPS